MKVFSFSPAAYREAFEQHGWVHVRDGLTSEFLDAALATVAQAERDRRLGGRGIAGAKAQFVFEFPEADHYDELFDAVAELCGLDRPAVTLSERHIKAYEADADPDPVAHKDRFASQVSMGLSLVVPEGSHLVLYPEDDVWENPFLNTALRDSLEDDRLPEVVLEGAQGVEIHDAPGDVVVFRGSAFWHLRRNSAETVNVYLKFNDFGADPLGEDPTTPQRRAATLALLEGDVAGVVPVLARRFDSVFREYRREGWPERLFANVWGQNPFPLSEAEDELLRSVDGRRTVAELGVDPALVRRLARRGALDLL
ncbi:MAG TPA: hypothetical protein VHF47_04935 [Acidimicrobiales bacterium]|nr:hypothetical protein [Acidimicrobiales bacterium]